jgi:hypothetical protein
MIICKLGGLACAAMLGSALLIGPASAMPANGLATVASKKVTSNIQDVRLVCGAYRCWNTWGSRRWGANRWGWGRGLYAYAGPGPGWGWRRPLYAAAGVGLAAAPGNVGFNPWYGGAYFGYIPWDFTWSTGNGYY